MNKLGRNDPCPCGSGKKYKLCCMLHEKTSAANNRPKEVFVEKQIPVAFQSAVEHHQAGRLPQAEAIYQQILQIKPNHPDVLGALGWLAHQTGKNSMAVDLIGKAIMANPSHAEYYCNLGVAHHALGRQDEAVACYRKALALKPEDAEAHYNLSIVLNNQGKQSEARASYQMALALKPDFARSIKRIFIAGMPRTKSMWVNNVVRALLVAEKKDPIPHFQPVSVKPLLEEAFISPMGKAEVYCVKTHSELRPNLPMTRIICTYRDPRPVMLSAMRFMKYDFDQALGWTQYHLEQIDYFRENHAQDIIFISYENSVAKPIEIVETIAKFLGLTPSRELIVNICEQFSKENVRKMIQEIHAEGADVQTVGKQHVRLMDRKTGFQTNHISSQNDDEWRDVFSPEQIEVMNATFRPWLEKYGYLL